MTEKQHVMHPEYLSIGDTVENSPSGPGVIEGFEDGCPYVNGVLVAVLIRTDGAVFNPLNLPLTACLAQWSAVDAKKLENSQSNT